MKWNETGVVQASEDELQTFSTAGSRTFRHHDVLIFTFICEVDLSVLPYISE